MNYLPEYKRFKCTKSKETIIIKKPLTLINESKKVGLVINEEKTKVIETTKNKT